MSICPRCESKQIEVVSQSLDNWEIYLCDVCFYTWRSSEPEAMIDPEKYDESFKVDPKDIPYTAEVPSVPKRI